MYTKERTEQGGGRDCVHRGEGRTEGEVLNKMVQEGLSEKVSFE